MQKINHTFVVLAYGKSKYLEKCIKSVINQTIKTNVVIATSTPNDYIKNIAKKNKLNIIVNKNKKGIAEDFNFAFNCVKSELITIAHQDDLYEKRYVESILDNYSKYGDATIIFTNYYEVRNNKKVCSNKNLKLKRLLLLPLKLKRLCKMEFIKRSALRFGNAICCPSVTFCKKNIKIKKIFISSFTSNMDWLAWEKISNIKGRFIYINKLLMGHRVHEESTTTKIINSGERTDEDYEMFCKFWPKVIARMITKIYKNSEKSNKVK